MKDNASRFIFALFAHSRNYGDRSLSISCKREARMHCQSRRTRSSNGAGSNQNVVCFNFRRSASASIAWADKFLRNSCSLLSTESPSSLHCPLPPSAAPLQMFNYALLSFPLALSSDQEHRDGRGHAPCLLVAAAAPTVG